MTSSNRCLVERTYPIQGNPENLERMYLASGGRWVFQKEKAYTYKSFTAAVKARDRHKPSMLGPREATPWSYRVVEL